MTIRMTNHVQRGIREAADFLKRFGAYCEKMRKRPSVWVKGEWTNGSPPTSEERPVYKCRKCEMLDELFRATQMDTTDMRLYWVMTELFVMLHEGRDYCKQSKEPEPPTPMEIRMSIRVADAFILKVKDMLKQPDKHLPKFGGCVVELKEKVE